MIKRYCQLSRTERELPIPFTPLRKPLPESRFGLVTSGGLYHRGHAAQMGRHIGHVLMGLRRRG